MIKTLLGFILVLLGVGTALSVLYPVEEPLDISLPQLQESFDKPKDIAQLLPSSERFSTQEASMRFALQLGLFGQLKAAGQQFVQLQDNPELTRFINETKTQLWIVKTKDNQRDWFILVLAAFDNKAAEIRYHNQTLQELGLDSQVILWPYK